MRSLGLAAILATLLLATAAAQPYIYVLAVKECGSSWTDSGALAKEIERILKKEAGLEIEISIVESIEEWGRLVEEGEPDLIIINAHGEVMPIPTEYGSDWEAFLKRLAYLIKEKGWIFINPVGYGFYYFGNTLSEDVGENMRVGDVGLATIATALGFSASAWPPGTSEAKATELGLKVVKALGLKLPDVISAARPITADVPPEWWLYEVKNDNRTAYAGAAFRCGKGLFVWGGLSWSGAWGRQTIDDQARFTVAMLAYILDPDLPSRPPRGGGFPLSSALYIVMGVGIVVLVIVVTLMLKGRGGGL